MKNVIRHMSNVVTIATLLTAAKSPAFEIEAGAAPTEPISENAEATEMARVGFSPKTAINTLEALSKAGASYFNAYGETEISFTALAPVIQTATADNLQVKVTPAAKAGQVKLSFKNTKNIPAELTVAQSERLKKLTERYKLACDNNQSRQF